MPPADSGNLVWQWAEIAGIFAVVAGVLIPLCNSLINRKVAERQLWSQENQEARRNLVARITDLETRFDLERREGDHKIDELRALADEHHQRYQQELDAYRKAVDVLRDDGNKLRNRIYELEFKLQRFGKETDWL